MSRTFSELQDNVWYLCLSTIDLSGHLTCTSGKCPVHFNVFLHHFFFQGGGGGEDSNKNIFFTEIHPYIIIDNKTHYVFSHNIGFKQQEPYKICKVKNSE